MGASDGSHLLGEATGLGGEGRAKEQVDQTDRALNLRTRTPPGRIPNTSDGRKQEAGWGCLGAGLLLTRPSLPCTGYTAAVGVPKLCPGQAGS